MATDDKDYVVVMMITQGGTGSGTSGPAVRKIWEHLYGINGEKVNPKKAAIPGTTPPAQLPTFARDGSSCRPREASNDGPAHQPPLDRAQPCHRPTTRLGAGRHHGPDPGHRHAAGLVGHVEQRDPHPRRLDGLPAQAPGQHHVSARARRRGDGHPRPPGPPHRHAAGLRRLRHRAAARAGDGYDDQRLALLADARRALDPACRSPRSSPWSSGWR